MSEIIEISKKLKKTQLYPHEDGNLVLGRPPKYKMPGFMIQDSESFAPQTMEERPPRRQKNGGNNVEFKLKIGLPSFKGRIDMENFIDWVKNVKSFF